MIPSAILSDHLQGRIGGRRVLAAVFVTFEFDPGFFELEILPVLFDVAVSHAKPIRLVQLEDAIRDCAGNIAVFYDADRLVNGTSGSASLDIRRIPVRHQPGVFHSKNIFVLVEAREGDENGHRAQSLLVGSLSANITRAGWWENVEACHFEELREGDATRLRDDLLDFLRKLNQRTTVLGPHRPVELIRDFITETVQRAQRTSDATLFTHFYPGNGSFVDFLDSCAGEYLRGLYLEVISPYLDDNPSSAPLEALIERFEPKAVRILLPRSRDGTAACSAQLFETIRKDDRVSWGKLPAQNLASGSAKDAADRFVHAKVYRFFSQKPKREFCFVGSVNLTSPAHSEKGNWETGYLVEVDCPRTPDFWLEIEGAKPVKFIPTDNTDPAKSGGTPLMLRYDWGTGVGDCFWDHRQLSPRLRLEMRGVTLCELDPLPNKTWVPLPADASARLSNHLKETSFVEVYGLGVRSGLALVQEEGMAQKPSLLLNLSAAEILRYWALLTADQRTAFIESKTLELGLDQEGAELLARAKIKWGNQTFFDRFAGMFHAFSCLEHAVREKLQARPPRESEADYRLFGKKYDSLGTLLDRVFQDSVFGDDVEKYIVMLCARQVVKELRNDFPEYWSKRKEQARSLEAALERSAELRGRVATTAGHSDMAAFLDWFDSWFLARAKTKEVAQC